MTRRADKSKRPIIEPLSRSYLWLPAFLGAACAVTISRSNRNKLNCASNDTPSTSRLTYAVTPSIAPPATHALRTSSSISQLWSAFGFALSAAIQASIPHVPQFETVAATRRSTLRSGAIPDLHGQRHSLPYGTYLCTASLIEPMPNSLPPSPTPIVGIRLRVASSKRSSTFAIADDMLASPRP